MARPRVVTPDACQKTKKRRSSQLAGICDAISGGEGSAQLKDELDKEGRDKLLKDEAFSREISPEEALSLKATHGFAWNKIRSMRRYRHATQKAKFTMHVHFSWFRSHGIVMPSEKRMRQCSDDLLGSNLASELDHSP